MIRLLDDVNFDKQGYSKYTNEGVFMNIVRNKNKIILSYALVHCHYPLHNLRFWSSKFADSYIIVDDSG